MMYSQQYKGYGITYYSMWGMTIVYDFMGSLKHFKGLGEEMGLKKAKEYIDKISKY
jgi:hypothetical protein